MLQVTGSYIDPRPPHRALLISLDESGECQLAILDGAEKVEGRYNVLAKIVIPFVILQSVAETLPTGLATVAQIPGYEPPTPEEMIDGLRAVSAELFELNEREKQRKIGDSNG